MAQPLQVVLSVDEMNSGVSNATILYCMSYGVPPNADLSTWSSYGCQSMSRLNKFFHFSSLSLILPLVDVRAGEWFFSVGFLAAQSDHSANLTNVNLMLDFEISCPFENQIIWRKTCHKIEIQSLDSSVETIGDSGDHLIAFNVSEIQDVGFSAKFANYFSLVFSNPISEVFIRFEGIPSKVIN